jgi:norsolorinic acid ketoreductase
MGNHGAKSSGMDKAPVTLEDSIGGMLSKAGFQALETCPVPWLNSSKIDVATKEHISGTFQSFDDSKFEW